MPKYETKDKALNAIQLLIDNGLLDVAQMQLKENGIKAIIKDGRIIDESDSTELWLEKFITVDKNMMSLKDDVRKLAKVNDEVLIVGPTGTGKELIANALHGKREGQFVSCNAAGLPENLVESELFGHARGAFTGAHTDKVGLITYAKDGTFFLDEIGELPMEAQAKLLRAIQLKKTRAVGSNVDKDSTCRFVFATNRDLHAMVKAGQFRADLLARISTFELHTLGLVDRQCDIEPILRSLPSGSNLINNRPKMVEWPPTEFNVRSLQQWVRRFTVLGKLPQ